MLQLSIIQQICIWALPLLFAITLHEAAHAYVANQCGDNTAKQLGRLSLNPIHHIDPLGTILIPLLIGVLTHFSFVIGYAKPVPIHWGRLKKPRRDMMLVALAGPFANLLMAFLWACCYKVAKLFHPSLPSLFLSLTAQAGMLINIVLAVLNLLPLPPLDGSRVISAMLPLRASIAYSKIEPYGFIILIILIVTGILGNLLFPIIKVILNALYFIF